MKKLFPSLPDAPGLSDVLKAYPSSAKLIMQLSDQILREPSDLTVAERELIAAYVSGLNACSFCFGAHTFIARAYGIAPEVIEALMEDAASAPVDGKIRPILAYVAKLTQAPSKLTEADAQAVYDAGWSEAALYDAVQTCAMFNFMNRIVEGTGVAAYPIDPSAASDAQLTERRGKSYTDFGKEIGVIDAD